MKRIYAIGIMDANTEQFRHIGHPIQTIGLATALGDSAIRRHHASANVAAQKCWHCQLDPSPLRIPYDGSRGACKTVKRWSSMVMRSVTTMVRSTGWLDAPGQSIHGPCPHAVLGDSLKLPVQRAPRLPLLCRPLRVNDCHGADGLRNHFLEIRQPVAEHPPGVTNG